MANIGDPLVLPTPTVGTVGPTYATQINAVLDETKVRLSQKVNLALSTDPAGGLPMGAQAISNVGAISLTAIGAAPTSLGTLQNYAGDLYWVDSTGATQLNRQDSGGGGLVAVNWQFVDVRDIGLQTGLENAGANTSILDYYLTTVYPSTAVRFVFPAGDFHFEQRARSSGTVAFSRASTTKAGVIPVGSVVQTAGAIKFVTTAPVTFSAGVATLSIGVMAAVGGPTGIVGAGAITTVVSTLFDTFTVTNASTTVTAAGGNVNIPSIRLDGTVHTAPKSFVGQGRHVTKLLQSGTGIVGSYDWHLLRADLGFVGLEVSNLTVAAGTIVNTSSNDQQHLIQIQGLTATTSDVVISNVFFGQAVGAQFNTLGEPANFGYVKRVKVVDCDFDGRGIGQGARSCIEVQRGSEDILFANITATGAKNSCFDSEVTSNGAAHRVTLIGCNFNNQYGRTVVVASLGGAGSSWPQAKNWSIIGCNFTGGTVNVSSAQRVTFTRCSFNFSRPVNPTVDALQPFGGTCYNQFYHNEDVTLTDCSFVNDTGRDSTTLLTTSQVPIPFANGYVTFTRATAVTSGIIPFNSIVQTAGAVQFTLVYGVAFAVGQLSATVQVKAVVTGGTGIVAAGAITTIVVPPAFDTFTVTNGAATVFEPQYTSRLTVNNCTSRNISGRGHINVNSVDNLKIQGSSFVTEGLRYTKGNLSISRVSTVSGGTIPAGSIFSTAGGVQFQLDNDSVWVAGNASKVANITSVLPGPASVVGAGTITTVVSALFDTFTCTNGSGMTAEVQSSFIAQAATTGNATGFQVQNNTFVSVNENYRQIISMSTGSSSVLTVGSVSITNNTADQAIDSTNTSSCLVVFDKPTANASVFDVNPIVQGNSVGGAYYTWIASNQLANKIFPIVSGSKAYRGSKQYEGTITPNGNVIAAPGDRYVWRPGVQTQETWVKAVQTSSAVQVQDFNGWQRLLLAGAPVSDTVEICSSTQVAAAFGNGVTYIPCKVGQVDSVTFQFTSSYTGNMTPAIEYAMSAANAGTIILDFSYVVVADGVDPSTAVTTITGSTVTPGNNVLKKTWDNTVTAGLSIPVTAGALVLMTVSRQNAGTHTGDMRILQCAVRAV